MPRRFGPEKRIITKYFREVSRDTRERRTFVDNKPWPRFKYTAEKTVRRAKELERISRLMEKHGIPIQRVLRRDSNRTIQDFVAGKPLEKMFLTQELLTQIAAGLAQMHSIRETGRLPQPSLERTRQRIQSSIASLVKEGVLSTTEGRRARAFLVNPPKQGDIVLSHKDITKGNVVVRNGKAYFIDIGDAGLVFRDLELARTIFNLNLTQTQKKQFLDAYRQNGGRTETLGKTARYWTAYVLLYKLYSRFARKFPAEEIRKLKAQLLKATI